MYRIPVSRTCIRHLPAVLQALLLVSYIGNQQLLHRRRQVVGKGLSLRNQAFIQSEVDRALTRANGRYDGYGHDKPLKE